MISCKHFVQYYETDKMGVTHHSNYIRWMEEVRAVFLDRIGFSYDKLEGMGIASPVTSVDCKYRAPSTFADEIEVQASIESFNGVTLRMRYRMLKQDGTLVCEGHSEHVFLNEKGFFIRLHRDYPDFYKALMDRVEGDGKA